MHSLITVFTPLNENLYFSTGKYRESSSLLDGTSCKDEKGNFLISFKIDRALIESILPEKPTHSVFKRCFIHHYGMKSLNYL